MRNPKKIKVGLFLAGALLLDTAAIFAFGWLAEEMLEGETQQFDSYVRTAVHRFATPELTGLMQIFSFLGSVAVLAVLSMLVVCLCLYFRRIRTAVLFAITMIGASCLSLALKYAFHRPRPVAFVGASPTSYSFPSGHALGSLCFYAVLAVIIYARVRGHVAQVLVWAAAVLLIGMIGLSRIYLGVHYPSDVIAGYCAGAGWVAAIGFLDEASIARGKHDSAGPQESYAHARSSR